MSFLAPLAAGFAILVPILVVFYLLKVRRQDYEVGSTFLWRHLTRDVTANEPWQRLRWNPLLLLQALVMLLIVAALARPYLARLGTAAGFEVIVLDGSASMEATDVKPSRFAAAQQAALDIVNHLPTTTPAALIEAGPTPRTLDGGTADRSALQSEITGARPAIGPSDMRGALELALALAQSQRGGRIDVISDGVFSDISDFSSSTVPIHFVMVGGQGQNEAITELSARPDPARTAQFSVFVRVDDFSTQQANNQLNLLVDGRQVDSRPVTAAPGKWSSFIFDNISANAHVIEAALARPDDLAADNQAYLVMQPQAPPKVLLVSSGNLFLLTALHYLSIQLFQATPDQYGALDADAYDVVVFDSYVPPILPKGNVLLINPPNTPLLPNTGSFGPLTATNIARQDPLLADVDLTGLEVRQAAKVTPPSWARVVVDGNDVPLLLTGQDQQQTVVALSFALQQSNLALLPTFPILMSNVIDTLAPRNTSGVADVGQGGLLSFQPASGVTRIVVQRPDHTTVTLPVAVNSPSVSYADTDEAGLYVVTQFAGDTVIAQHTYPVNVLNSAVSNIRAAAPPNFNTTNTGGAGNLTQGVSTIAPFEIWPYVALVAALLLLGEWWWYHRRA